MARQRVTEAGLVWRSAESAADTFVFKHALLRDAAYDLLSRQSRQAYHSRIAGALDLSPDERAQLFELAGRTDPETLAQATAR